MKKIGVLEIDHYEMGYALLKVLSCDNEVFCFTTSELKERLIERFGNKINWIVREGGETLPVFYKRIISDVNKFNIDIMLINTIVENLMELANE